MSSITQLRETVHQMWQAFTRNVQTDERLTELAMVGDVDELLALATTAGKLGLREADLEPMARLWYTPGARGLTQQDMRDLAGIIHRHERGI